MLVGFNLGVGRVYLRLLQRRVFPVNVNLNFEQVLDPVKLGSQVRFLIRQSLSVTGEGSDGVGVKFGAIFVSGLAEGFIEVGHEPCWVLALVLEVSHHISKLVGVLLLKFLHDVGETHGRRIQLLVHPLKLGRVAINLFFHFFGVLPVILEIAFVLQNRFFSLSDLLLFGVAVILELI